MTNNPNKLAQLTQYGVKVTGRSAPHPPARTSTTASTSRPRASARGTSASAASRVSVEQSDPVLVEGMSRELED
jgi:hypothetical protein